MVRAATDGLAGVLKARISDGWMGWQVEPSLTKS
jgi:hypothetical protein